MNKVLKALRHEETRHFKNHKPQHIHDCDNCEFLGNVTIETRNYDLYYCEQGGLHPTFIARYGRYEKYASGMILIDTHPALAIAFARKMIKDYTIYG